MDDRTSEVVVLAGGGPPEPSVAHRLPTDPYVIAADSGLEHAVTLGLTVDLVVGDMDSVDPDVLAAAEEAGVAVERHPVAKDQTDLELALDRALALGASRVTVVGPDGGRLDHLLAVALGAAAPRFGAMQVQAWLGRAWVGVVRDTTLTLVGMPGEMVTLLPVHGSAVGVTTEGLRYPLGDEDLVAGTTRGVSNELARRRATVRLRRGVLLAIRPDALRP